MMSPTGMRRRHPVRNAARRGFTLVELAVAVAILVGGIAGILMALGRVLEGAHTALLLTQATALAQTRLAEADVSARAQPPVPKETGREDRFEWVTTVAPWPAQRPWQWRTSTVTWTTHHVARQAELQQVAWAPAGETGS